LFTGLSEEGQRAKKEELDEEELLVFDLLASNKKISDKEKHNLKEAAKSLLKRLKSKEFKVSQWTVKTQTASQVRKVINDLLYQELPYPTYGDDDINVKTEMLFNEFQIRYAHFGALVA